MAKTAVTTAAPSQEPSTTEISTNNPTNAVPTTVLTTIKVATTSPHVQSTTSRGNSPTATEATGTQTAT